MEKAVSQILRQLDEIKNGNFDYEFKSSKISLTDAINSVYDAPESLENWYLSQITDSEFKAPGESAARNNAFFHAANTLLSSIAATSAFVP